MYKNSLNYSDRFYHPLLVVFIWYHAKNDPAAAREAWSQHQVLLDKDSASSPSIHPYFFRFTRAQQTGFEQGIKAYYQSDAFFDTYMDRVGV